MERLPRFAAHARHSVNQPGSNANLRAKRCNPLHPSKKQTGHPYDKGKCEEGAYGKITGQGIREDQNATGYENQGTPARRSVFVFHP